MNSKNNTTPRFIDLYYEWMEKGELPADGLCNSLPHSDIFELLIPEASDFRVLEDAGLCTAFWASDRNRNDSYYDSAYPFNPLRQNIVLLMAAINDEL